VKRNGVLGWFNDEFFTMNFERSPGFPELTLYLSLGSLLWRAFLLVSMLGITAMWAWLMILSFNASELAFGLIFVPPMLAFAYFGVFKTASGFSRRDNHLHLIERGLEVVSYGKKTFWAWEEINGFSSEVGRRRYFTEVVLKGAKPSPPVSYRSNIPEQLESYAVGAHGYQYPRDLFNAWLERYGSPEPAFLETHDKNAQWVRIGKRINRFFGVRSGRDG
jgi:hypothetical protein